MNNKKSEAIKKVVEIMSENNLNWQDFIDEYHKLTKTN